MSMQNYGACALLVDTEKMNEESVEIKTAFEKINISLEKSENEVTDILEEENVELDTHGKTAKKEIQSYIAIVKEKLGIDLDPFYINDEAEGTELKEKLLFAIEYELPAYVAPYSLGMTTWSVYG